MPVTTTKSSRVFGGNGVATVFACDFRIFAATDITATLVDPNTGATTLLVINTDYTITGANNDSGFTLTTIVPVPTGKNLLVDRQVAYTQPTSFTNQSRFFPILHQDMADRLAMQVQQLVTLNGNTLKKPNEAVNYYDLSGNRLSNVGTGTSGTDGVNVTQLSGALATSNAYTDNAVAGVVGGFGFFQQIGTGAQGRTFQDKMRDTVSVLDYMTVAQIASVRAGNRAVDVTAAIQAACNTGASTIHLPAGGYQVSGTITLAANQTIIGDGRKINGGAIVYAGSGQNSPVFKISAGAGEIKNMSILGSSTSVATASQKLIYINNTSSCTIQECYFNGGYDAIFIDGSSFYTSIYDCIFDANFHGQLTINSVTGPGVDLMVARCRFLGMTSTGFACVYAFGLGSMQMSDCGFTLNQISGASLYLDTPAALFGGAVFTNCIFENGGSATGPSVYVKGSSGSPWNTLHFTGGLVTGGASGGLKVDYVKGLTFTGVTFSSTSSTGSVFLSASAQASDIRLVSCGFEGTSNVPPIQCGLNAALSMDVISPRWTGVASLINFIQTTAASIGYLNVFGGTFGTAVPRLTLPSPASVPGTQITDGAWVTYTPTVTAVTGTITSYSAAGSFQKIGKVLHFRVSVAFTANGTGAGAVNITLPRNALEASAASGKAIQISGKALIASMATGTALLRVSNYDGTYPAVDGEVIVVSGTYQTD